MKYTVWLAAVLVVVVIAIGIVTTYSNPVPPECVRGSSGSMVRRITIAWEQGECIGRVRRIQKLKQLLRESVRERACAVPQTSAEAIESCKRATERVEQGAAEPDR